MFCVYLFKSLFEEISGNLTRFLSALSVSHLLVPPSLLLAAEDQHHLVRQAVCSSEEELPHRVVAPLGRQVHTQQVHKPFGNPADRSTQCSCSVSQSICSEGAYETYLLAHNRLHSHEVPGKGVVGEIEGVVAAQCQPC